MKSIIILLVYSFIVITVAKGNYSFKDYFLHLKNKILKDSLALKHQKQIEREKIQLEKNKKNIEICKKEVNNL